MISQVKLVFSYCLISSLFIMNLEAAPVSKNQRFGTAFITSVAGNSINFKNSTTTHSIRLHDSIILNSDTLISTGDRDYVFFKLSNNTTFGILESTQFSIQSFQQDTFTDRDVRFDREPSISNFKSTLDEGTIVVKSNIISPLSIFEIHLPDSKLELYSAIAVISYRYNILHIALYEGNISLKSNNSIKHINAPSYYVIDSYNLKNSIDNYDADLSEAPSQWNLLKDSISVENNRVIFTPEERSSQSAAKAKLISIKDFYNQNFIQPRSFQKLEFKDSKD